MTFQTPDHIFTDGFDKYGPPGNSNYTSNLFTEWDGYNGATGVSIAGIAALRGTGYAFRMGVSVGTGFKMIVSKAFPSNAARAIGGATVRFASFANRRLGIGYTDGTTSQLTIGVDTAGALSVWRGGVNSTLLAVSATTVSTGTVYVLEWDVVFHDTLGRVRVWLNGSPVTDLSLDNVDTQASTNAYATAINIQMGTNATSAGANIEVDHLYHWGYNSAAVLTGTPALDNPLILTDTVIDDAAARGSTVGAGRLGINTSDGTAAATNAANRITMKRIQAEESGTVSHVVFLPGTTSATVKFKAGMWADSAGSPGSLLSDGPEVVGSTSGTFREMALTTPQAITAGTWYWLGWIQDTSITCGRIDATASGASGAAYTYTSGVPSPAPAVTGLTSNFRIFAKMSAVGEAWAQVNDNPYDTTYSYNVLTTIGTRDEFTPSPLAVNPLTIYCVSVKVATQLVDGGARSVDIEVGQSSTRYTGIGGAGVIIPQTYPTPVMIYATAAFINNPFTSAAWTKAQLDITKLSYKIAA